MRLSAGPCFSVIVPTIMSRSDWRGEKRGNSAPKRAMSYLGAATDMNSMPQDAVTNGYENNENLRPQLATSSSLEVTSSSMRSSSPAGSVPADGLLAPHVRKSDHQDGNEQQHFSETEDADTSRGGKRQLREQLRPRVH